MRNIKPPFTNLLELAIRENYCFTQKEKFNKSGIMKQYRNISGTCLIFPVKLSVKVERPFLRSSQVLLIEIMHVIYETSKRTALQFFYVTS